MKKQAICMTLSCLFVAGAHAQNSVTLYGVIDEGFDYTNNVNGKKDYELQSGYAQGSRWGLKGAEDLGGGVKAIFTLENGFNVNNGRLGQGGLEFGRQAFVGLSDATYGTVTLGRQYDSVVDFLAQTTANGNWAGYLFAHPYDNDNTDNSFRVNNTVKYTSPTWAGFQFGGMYGFSNVAGGFANNRLMSVGAQYTYGGLLIAAAYLNSDNPSGTANGAIPTTDQNFLAQRLRIFGAGINYTMAWAMPRSALHTPTRTCPIRLPLPTSRDRSCRWAGPYRRSSSITSRSTASINLRRRFLSAHSMSIHALPITPAPAPAIRTINRWG